MRQLSYALQSKTFSLEVPEDFPIAFIRDEQGFLEPDEVEAAICALSNMLEVMQREGKDQAEILADCEKAKNQALLAPPYWILPTGSFLDGRTRIAGRCVYFVYSPKNNEIKIGHTSNLAHRLWGISRLSGDERDDLQVIAAVSCIDVARLEAYIHEQIAHALIHGEWFQVATVLDFIAKCSGVRPQVRA